MAEIRITVDPGNLDDALNEACRLSRLLGVTITFSACNSEWTVIEKAFLGMALQHPKDGHAILWQRAHGSSTWSVAADRPPQEYSGTRESATLLAAPAEVLTKTVRVELPVILYLDLEFTILDERDEISIDAVRQRLWDILGEPGAEVGINITRVPEGTKQCGIEGASHARLYPSDHDWCDSEGKLEIVEIVTD